MIIISRKKEDISWLNQFSNLIVYNIDNNNDNNDNDNDNDILNCNLIINHNYHHLYSLFHYIYNNYDNLDECIVFITLDNANGLDNHFKNFLIDKIKYYNNNNNNLNSYFEYFAREYIILNSNIILVDYNLKFHENELDSNILYIDTEKHFNDNNYFKKIYIELFGYFEDIILKRPDDNNMFIVSKNNILRRNKTYYLNILNMLNYCEYPEFTREYFIIDALLEKIFTNELTEFNSVLNYPFIKDEIDIVKDEIDIVKDEANIYNFKPQCEYCEIEFKKYPNFITLFCSNECYNKHLECCNKHLECCNIKSCEFE
jgi:hypothetical protein